MVERYSILTGDVVGSTGIPADRVEMIFDRLQHASRVIAGWTGRTVPKLERFRGDGWQFALPACRWSLRATLYFRAAVRSVHADADTRIAVGIGPADLKEALAQSGGDAFERSGRCLDQLRGQSRLAIDIGDVSPPESNLFMAVFRLSDSASTRWTPGQANVFTELAVPDAPFQASVADRLGVSRQTVQQHFSRANGPALVDAAECFEEIFS